MKRKPNKEIQDNIKEAIKTNNAAELEKLIKSGYDFNIKINKYGETPLHLAAYNNTIDCLKLLLAIPGIKLNKGEKGLGHTPLHQAIFHNNIECVKLLLNTPGININRRPRYRGYYIGMSFPGCTPLYTAAENGHTECIELLLAQKGILVNKGDGTGDTPLHAAAENGHTECLKLLLNTPDIQVNKKGAKQYGQSKRFRPTALEQALANKSNIHTECVKALLEHPGINTKNIPAAILAVAKNAPDELQRLITDSAEVNRRDRWGYTALHHAVLSNNPACVKILLQANAITPNLNNNIYKSSAIELATGLGYTECLKLLLASDKVKRDAKTLYTAARNDKPACEKLLLQDAHIAATYSPSELAVIHDDVETLRKLIAKGADINAAVDDEGQTLLHIAASDDEHHDCLQLLLNQAKINPNAADKWGASPLHVAAYYDASKNITALLEHPATDINKATNNGITPWDSGAEKYRARRILKERGAKGRKWHYLFTRPWSVGCIWLGAALGLLGTCHYSDKYDSLSKVIIEAAANGDIYTLGELVHAGADLDYAPDALRAAYYDINTSENAKDCFLFLLSQPGVEPNETDYNDSTLLHMAAANGNTEIVEALLATPHIKAHLSDKDGNTPLHLAARNGHKDCVNLLLKAPGVDDSLWNAPEWAVVNNDADSLYQLVNANAADYTTALHFAVSLGYTHCLQALLTAPNIDVNASDNDGNTPLHIAIKQGLEECVKLLLAHPNIRVGKISTFIQSPNTACVLAALAHPTAERATFPQVLIAVRTNNCEELKKLIETGEFDKMKKGQKLNAIALAGKFGHTECVNILLQAPFYATKEGISHEALYHAALYGQKECVQALLENPAIEVNCLSSFYGECSRNEKFSECLQLIMQSAKFDVKKSFFPIFEVCTSYKDDESIKMLLSKPGVDVNAQDENGYTPLHYAVSHGHENAVRTLLAIPGIDVNIKNKYGWSPRDCNNTGDKVIDTLLRRAGGKHTR